MSVIKLLILLAWLRLELVLTELYRRWLETRIIFGFAQNERLLWQILERI